MKIRSSRLTALVVVLASLAFMTGMRHAQSADQDSTGLKMKTESFDRDPGWIGVNNHTARTHSPRQVRQDFGFSATTSHAGGAGAGEMGGFISGAGEVAYYGKAIAPVTLDQPLSASGVLNIGPGGAHVLLGFFNSDSVKEWRTPNTISLRLYARGQKFISYVEYCTSTWRAGGDNTPFPSARDPKTGRLGLIGYPCSKSLPWSLTYDPKGNHGNGTIRATIGSDTAVCNLTPAHRVDGATFNRFGLMNVMKSAVNGSEMWFDDIRVNDGPAESFSKDPGWDGRGNRATTQTRLVRPWFNFGFSETSFAGGKGKGELGGQIFRGDCRYPERMACYGDQVGPLTLEKPLRASGKVAMRRGVTDSTTLFGFFNSKDSMRRNDAQNDGLPESVGGVHIEGPSREGFLFYPVYRLKDGRGKHSRVSGFPHIYPDSKSHDWTFEYSPDAADGRGRITVSLDGKAGSFDLEKGEKSRGTTFDRFGIITSWIDGNSQDVYWDDITYTVGQ